MGADGEKVKRHGQLWFGVREVRGWAGCQDRRKRAEVQERGGIGWGFRAAFGVRVRGRTGQEMESLSGTPRL